MTTENTLPQAKTAETCEDLKPLINRLDDICDRLELMEAISELAFVCKQFDTQEISITTKSFGQLGHLISFKNYVEILHLLTNIVK